MEVPTIRVRKPGEKGEIVVNAGHMDYWRSRGYVPATDPTRTKSSKPIVVKETPKAEEE